MKTLNTQYKLIKEGKGHKGVFLNESKRQFPQYIRNAATFDEAVNILKDRGIINENLVGLTPVNNIDREKEDYELAFNNYLEEAKKKKEDNTKAEEKNTSKEVEEDLSKNYDKSDDQNPDNVIYDQLRRGFYVESCDSKNSDKTVDQIKDIVLKNLKKNPIFYAEDGQFGIKGVGYETEVPGLGTPKEPKGPHKSSGYGTLKEGKEYGWSKDDVYKLVDYHERTGMLPKDMSVEEYHSLLTHYGILPDREDFTDPAGGSGLESHLEEGLEWWHPLVALGASVGLVASTIFAFLGPGMIISPGSIVSGDSWVDVYRHYKKKFKDKRTAKNLKKEDVLELINLIQISIDESDLEERAPGVKRYMKGLMNKLENEMNKDEEELDHDRLLALLRDVQNYAKRMAWRHKIDLPSNPGSTSLQEQKLRKVINGMIREVLTENKKAQKTIAEIEKEAKLAEITTKVEALNQAIEERTQRLESIEENEDMRELMDKKALKDLKKEIKVLEKYKSKCDKLYEKISKKTEGKKVVTDQPVEEAEGDPEDTEKMKTDMEDIASSAKEISDLELFETYPEEGTEEFEELLKAKEAAEERIDAGEDIDSVVNDFPQFKDILYQDLKGKYEGSDY